MLDFIYGFSCVFLPCFLYQLLIKHRLEYDRRYRLHLILVYIFLFYIFLLMLLMDIGHFWDFSKYEFLTYDSFFKVNLIPMFYFNLKDAFLIFLFLPFGFLPPIIWESYRNLKSNTMLSFIFSALVEICQLFNMSVSDITTVILSVFGAVIGYFLYFLVSKNRFVKNLCSKTISISENEALNYIFMSVFGIFFLYNWNVFNFMNI